MADDKTYSEDEHIAILADRVARETASLTVERDQLQTEKADLENKLDVAESAKQAAETAKDNAERELAEFKAEVEAREEAAAKKDERLAKAREVAKHLDAAFFEDEKRIERIVAMSDDQFDGYVSDLASTATVAGNSGSTTVPRETAMAGAAVGGKSTVSAGKAFLMRDFVAPTQTKEG